MGDAGTWVGPGEASDKLDLAKIEPAIAPEAADLHAALQTAKIAGLFKMRSEASRIAAGAQSWFKRLSAAAVISTAVATLTSGLLLYGAGSEASAATVVEGLVRWVKDNNPYILWIQIVTLFVSALVASVLASQNYAERWQEQRNRAELLRRQIFDEVLTLAKAKVPNLLGAADPGNPIAQALEFFRRYEHELQITFYRTASTRHARVATRLSWLTAVLAGLAAITGALSGFGGSALVASAFLGISVPILLSAAQSWRASSRDSDKLTAYEKAKQALESNLLDIDSVRARAAMGDAAAVGAYVNSVHLIMTETDAWRTASTS